MKRKLTLLLISLSPALLLSGCAEGGGFDIVKFTQNPVVMILLAVVIVIYMMKRSK